MKVPGIHIRLLITAVLLITATTFTLGVIGINITRGFVVERYRNHVTVMARYLAANSEVGILVGDRSWLRKQANGLLREEKDIARIEIRNAAGETLAKVSNPTVKGAIEFEMPVTPEKPTDINLLFSQSALNVLTENMSVKPIGSVLIVYSMQSVDTLMREITTRFILFSGLLAALAGIVFHFISATIVDQVTKLAKAADEVADGSIDRRADPGSLPETRMLAVAFNRMLDSLERSRKALAKKDQDMMRQRSLAEMGKFSMMIAHEVKNPLGIMKGSLDILRKDPKPETRELAVGYIDDEIKRLNRLIEHFLMFAKPAAPNFRDVDVAGLILDVANRFILQNDGAAAAIQTDVSGGAGRISADPDLLMRAVGNIIRNACDAAPETGGRIRVAAEKRGEDIVIEVSDNGEGIPAENLERIFDPFFTTRSKGSGLGLAFAAHVIRAHGGEIAAENMPGGGALFRVTLHPRPDEGDVGGLPEMTPGAPGGGEPGK